MAISTRKSQDVDKLISGSVAGIISRTLTHPLERLRILQQTGNAFGQKGIVSSIKHMYRHEGITGLFRGNGVNVMVQAPFTALEFYFYDKYTNNLFPG